MKLAERQRNYHVMMYGLSEENRVCKLSPEELSRRQREIWDICFGGFETKKEDTRQ